MMRYAGKRTCLRCIMLGKVLVMSESPASAAGTLTIGSDLVVNRLGYGAMRLTGSGMWGEYPDRDGGIALLKRVVEAGVTFIDTADSYGPHTNEVLIHDALYPYPADLVIATKGGFIRGGPDYADFGVVGNREYLRQCAYLSARRLGIEQIDLYYLHNPRATDAPFEDQIATLAELREQGVIRHIGLSNVNVEQFRAAREIVEIAAVTAHYNIGDRTGPDCSRPLRGPVWSSPRGTPPPYQTKARALRISAMFSPPSVKSTVPRCRR